jgi:hypothetical protein
MQQRSDDGQGNQHYLAGKRKRNGQRPPRTRGILADDRIKHDRLLLADIVFSKTRAGDFDGFDTTGRE